jgi:hypothetical protein
MLKFETNDPKRLLALLQRAIDLPHGTAGRIDTWEYVLYEGRYFFTHTSPNWAKKAWLRADVESSGLAFYVRPYKGVALTRDAYAYYVGHLAETLIRHFPTYFSRAVTTPNATGNDAPF